MGADSTQMIAPTIYSKYSLALLLHMADLVACYIDEKSFIMNKLIREQLNKCDTARLPKFDDDTTHILIKKYEPVSVLKREAVI